MATEHFPRDTPFIDAQQVILSASEQATITYSLSNTRSQFHLVMLAASKHTDVIYTVEMDGSEEWKAPIPPTDVDNAQDTYVPAKVFRNDMEVQVANVGDVDRRVNVVIKGWERPPTVDEGGL